MIDALHSAQHADNGAEAGEILAHGGWAVFPVPVAHDARDCATCRPVWQKKKTHCKGKHDQGTGALTYTHATTSFVIWRAHAENTMRRHNVDDVNPAVSPWKCETPLVGIDLDGPAAVAAFREQHPGDYFRIETSGHGGGGLHVYVAGCTTSPQGTNPWGGEYRGCSGHLVLPPSIIDGRRDYYRPTGGSTFLTGVELPARTRSSNPTAAPVTAVATAIAGLSGFPPTGHGRRVLLARLEHLRCAPEGERHPRLVTAAACAVALAHRRHYPLDAAIALITQWFPVWEGDPARDIDAETRAIIAWAIVQENAA